jgi:hypothetical protein
MWGTGAVLLIGWQSRGLTGGALSLQQVETRLEKEMKEMKALLEAENKKQPADERQTPQEIEDMAKKVGASASVTSRH